MQDEPYDPAPLHVEEFLAGPGRSGPAEDGGSYVVDDVMGKDFACVWREQEEEHRLRGAASLEIAGDAVRTPSALREGYAFVEVEAGLLLLAPDGGPCGGYIGCDVALAPGHQGRGLGAELILEYAMRHGGIPTWDLQEAAYSRAGERAHRHAHALARNRPLFERKAEALRQAWAAARAPAP